MLKNKSGSKNKKWVEKTAGVKIKSRLKKNGVFFINIISNN